MKTNKPLYILTVEDFQTVSIEELGRKLSEKELALVADRVGDKIDWYDIIQESIWEKEKEFRKLKKDRAKK
jgi:hypothetical protein